MSASEDKDKEKRTDPKSTTPDERVIPIHDGKAQGETTLEQAVIDLGNNHPTTWSIIR